jgi:DNA-directed RNA polymerase specialized sigma24 family protein
MTDDRPPRLRPLPGTFADAAPDRSAALSDAALLELLEQALAGLPRAERAAAVVAYGLDEGTQGVAHDLGLSEPEADALTRSAVQLLRGALADVDMDEPQVHARLEQRRRRRTSSAPDTG